MHVLCTVKFIMEESFYECSLPSCIRKYHIYKELWQPTIGEELACTREQNNVVDRYAVAIMKENTLTVSHLPRKISKISSLFLCCGGVLTCKVTGQKRHSTDPVQGGLEIPSSWYR